MHVCFLMLSSCTLYALHCMCLCTTVACYHFWLIFVINKIIHTVICVHACGLFLINIVRLDKSVDFSGRIDCIPFCVEACHVRHQRFWMFHKFIVAK